MQDSRDFGVAFWIIATIDFFNSRLDSCTVRVPTSTECVLLFKTESDAHLQVEVQAQRFPIVRTADTASYPSALSSDRKVGRRVCLPKPCLGRTKNILQGFDLEG